jgi:hypothetical protein
MTQRFLYLFAILLVGSSVTQVQAGWNEFVQRSVLDWHRNNTWPQPFVHSDRMATCSPFVIMSQNGLCGEFTLGDHHFDPVSQSLSEAGQLKVADIIRRQPAGMAQVFVVNGRDDEISAIRLDSVQQTLAKVVTDGTLPEVRFTNYSPRGVPASYIDAVGRKLDATVPNPRLPEFSSTTN